MSFSKRKNIQEEEEWLVYVNNCECIEATFTRYIYGSENSWVSINTISSHLYRKKTFQFIHNIRKVVKENEKHDEEDVRLI